jgi:hypothetical protein
MVSLALTLKDVDLSKIVFVQYPSVDDPDDPNKVVPAQSLADDLFTKVLADQPFTLGADSTSTGSTVVADPGAEVPAPVETAAPEATDPATGAPTTEAAPEVIEGLKGQTAAQETCANPFDG